MPSTASSGRTCTRSPSIATTSTSCRPIGFGRSAERVPNTPRSGPRRVVARVDLQDVAARAVQPGEDDQAVARRDALEPGDDARLEGDPRVGRALVALLRRRRGIGEGGGDGADRAQLDHAVASSLTCVSRKLLPDGSRKPESMPYGYSSGSEVNSTPRALSSS